MLKSIEEDKIGKLIKKHETLIKNISIKYYSSNLKNISSYEDYYQESCIALMNAYQGFEESLGDFEPYLYTVINNHLSAYVAASNYPVKLNKKIVKLSVDIYNLMQKGMNSEQICNELKISKTRYLRCCNILNIEKIEKNSISSKKIENIYLFDIKSLLEDNEHIMFRMWINDYSLKEISLKMGWSYEWTRQKMTGMIKKVSKYFEDEKD